MFIPYPLAVMGAGRVSRGRWLVLGLLAAAVFAGLLAYGDLRHIGGLLAADPVSAARAVGAAAGLALANYGLRFLRWHLYLRALGIEAPLRTVSLPVFLAGLALSITPGKAGELLKSLWLRRLAGVPAAASAPAVVMERLTDVVSVALLGLTGLALLPAPFLLIAGGLLAVGIGAGWLAASRLGSVLLRLPGLRRWAEPLGQSQEGLRRLMRPRMLAMAIGLGFLAWAAEGLALWVIIVGIGGWVDPMAALPISAAAALAGAVTALPGGLVGFEGSMVVLLQQAGLTVPAASLATLLTRLATLWLAVLIGLAAWVRLLRAGGAGGTLALAAASSATPVMPSSAPASSATASSAPASSAMASSAPASSATASSETSSSAMPPSATAAAATASSEMLPAVEAAPEVGGEAASVASLRCRRDGETGCR